MAVIFFDTSALVRRYDAAEPGSARVEALCRAAAGHVLLIARITPLEVASALNRKLRERRLDASSRDRRWRLFRLHLRDRYRAITIDEQGLQVAEQLLFDHALRAFDALQLASALRSMRLLTDLTEDFRFCTADQAQARAAGREGLATDVIA